MTLARQVPEQIEAEGALPGMIGAHPSMRAVYRLVRRVAPSDLPLVIVGETGTGKELVARAAHALSRRAAGPLVDVNCAAIPEGLVEGELFGWERGSFTGAHQRVPGLLELADGGTLFLDEACSLPPAVQGKLLRALEHGSFRRVGGRTALRSDFRLMLALARPIAGLVESGTFRDDFAFRVAGVVIELPPLRARGHDVRLLAEHFLTATTYTAGPPLRWHEDALGLLCAQRWPGNVRELEMLVRRVAALADGAVIGAGDLGAAGFAPRADVSDEQLREAIESSGGNVSRAARLLGKPRTTLYDRLRKQRLNPPEEVLRGCRPTVQG